MFKIRMILAAVIAACCVFCSVEGAVAIGNLSIGAMDIEPFASITQRYDDNIFLEPNNQEDDDWITTVTLGTGVSAPLVAGREEDFLFKAKYNADIISFWDFNNQNRVDHNLDAAVDMKFSNDSTLKLKEKFEATADPATSELTSLEKRYRNTAGAVLGYTREKIGADIGYTNILDDYKRLNSLDKTEQVVTATGYYQLFPKTSVFGEYNYGKIEYDINTTNSDSRYDQFRVGAKGEISPKLTGLVKAGYKKTDYDQSSKKNFEGGTVFANLAYVLKERSTLNFFGERGSEESTYSTNSYFEYNKAGMTLDHMLRETLFLTGGGYFQLNKYPDETTESGVRARRKDNIWNASVGLRYEIKKWVNVETDYEYKKRDSEFSTFDYTDNRYTTKLNFLF